MVSQIKQISRGKVLVVGLVAGVLVAGPIGAFALTTNQSDPPPTTQLNLVTNDVDKLAPTVPTDLVGSDITSASITVHWAASTDNIDVMPMYDIRFNGTEISGISSTGYVLTDLSAATKYSIEVRSRDTAGNTSAYSSQLVVSTSPLELPTPPKPTTPVKPTVPVTPVVEPGEDPTTEPVVEADLQAAIAIAYEEHAAEVIAAKLVYLNGEKVYKITFVDGWRAYVRASDGDMVMLKDWFNVSKPIEHKAKKAWMKAHHHWNPWSNEYRAWAKSWFKQHNWSGYYGGYNGWYNRAKPAEQTDADKSTEATVSSESRTSVKTETKNWSRHDSDRRR